jgi:hypothetical protein
MDSANPREKIVGNGPKDMLKSCSLIAPHPRTKYECVLYRMIEVFTLHVLQQ